MRYKTVTTLISEPLDISNKIAYYDKQGWDLVTSFVKNVDGTEVIYLIFKDRLNQG